MAWKLGIQRPVLSWSLLLVSVVVTACSVQPASPPSEAYTSGMRYELSDKRKAELKERIRSEPTSKDLMRLGDYYESFLDEPESAIGWYIRAAKEGSTRAKNRLGIMLCVDSDRSVRMFGRSLLEDLARMGDEPAKENLMYHCKSESGEPAKMKK